MNRPRRWLTPYQGPLPVDGASWWPAADDDDAFATVASLVELLTADDCSTLARQCARDELDSWVRTASTGDVTDTRLLVAYAASLATTARFARSSVLLAELAAQPTVPLVVAAGARIGLVHLADRWRSHASVTDDVAADAVPTRHQLVSFACRLAERGPLAVDLVALFDATFHTTAGTVVVAVLEVCDQIPAGFPTRVARTLTAEWDGDPRDIPTAVATLI